MIRIRIQSLNVLAIILLENNGAFPNTHEFGMCVHSNQIRSPHPIKVDYTRPANQINNPRNNGVVYKQASLLDCCNLYIGYFLNNNADIIIAIESG